MIHTALWLAYLAFWIALWIACSILVWVVLLPVSGVIVGALGSSVGLAGSVGLFAMMVLWLRRRERARC